MHNDQPRPAARLLAAARQYASVWNRPDANPQWRYPSFAALLLDLGRVFTPSPWPGGQPQGPPGRCFANATSYAELTGLTYVEGLVLTAGDPFGFEHAWCAATDGSAVDPSLPDGVPLAYLGVPVTSEYRRQQQAKRRQPGGPSIPAVFTQCHGDFTVNDDALRDGVPPTALVAIGEPVPPGPADPLPWARP